MTTIRLTPQRRQDLSERRRHAPDRRAYQRLAAVLWSDQGRAREEIAGLLGVATRQGGQWLRTFRDQGLDELTTLHYQGDPGRLGPAQVERVEREIATGASHTAEQVRTRAQDTLGVASSTSGIKGLLRRIGAGYHRVSGSSWKADVEKRKGWVREDRRHKEAGPKARRSFVDACHPVWGVGPVDPCWRPVGQRSHAGAGNGRKRLDILGAYSPDDHDSVGLGLTREDLTGGQFVVPPEALRAKRPGTERFIPYLDNARYHSKPCVKAWVAAHRRFRLVPLPAYSPDPNLIERLWESLRKAALNRWHVTFEAMQGAVAEVRDRLGDHRDGLPTRMAERFAIVEVEPAVA